jgi:DNA modification methylase
MCGWMSTSDLILLFQNGEGKMNFYGKCSHDVYVKNKMEKEGFNHPAQKPVWLMEDLIQRLTKENDIILDPFAGSGTTGVACRNLKRNFILIEKEKEYIDIINKRLFPPESITLTSKK